VPNLFIPEYPVPGKEKTCSMLFSITWKRVAIFNLKEQRWGQWGEMNQSLYAHMNNKRKMKKKKSKDKNEK
jgi:hypothetical protein